MSRILVVEDSAMFANLIRKEILTRLGHEVVLAKSYAETERLLNDNEEESFFSADYFSVAVLDLNLPDAPSGKIVDLVQARSIPAIVFTSELDNAIRDLIWSKEIVDYVLKRDRHDIAYLVTLIERLLANAAIRILVVDDSRAFRSRVCGLLKVHKYEVLEAGDGVEALKRIEQNPGVNLVITDYEMPNMDGFVLSQKIREIYGRDSMAVIGISARDEPGLSARFIKNGANDFIGKPFSTEEFYCRVTQNVETIERVRKLKQVEAALEKVRECSFPSMPHAETGARAILDSIIGAAQEVLGTKLTSRQSACLREIQDSADRLRKRLTD